MKGGRKGEIGEGWNRGMIGSLRKEWEGSSNEDKKEERRRGLRQEGRRTVTV